MGESRSHSALPRLFSFRSKDSCFSENTPLLRNSSQEKGLQCMPICPPDPTTAEESWGHSPTDWERSHLLGRDGAGLSGSASTEENGDFPDGVPGTFCVWTLRSCVRGLTVTGLFILVVVCSNTLRAQQTLPRLKSTSDAHTPGRVLERGRVQVFSERQRLGVMASLKWKKTSRGRDGGSCGTEGELSLEARKGCEVAGGREAMEWALSASCHD
ncbi:P protein-like [Loxodonta africana]|uniref:P protein-like n=1 Tax=Loxodonta africana TaxID=9785 RepID=UPI0030D53D38